MKFELALHMPNGGVGMRIFWRYFQYRTYFLESKINFFCEIEISRIFLGKKIRKI